MLAPIHRQFDDALGSASQSYAVPALSEQKFAGAIRKLTNLYSHKAGKELDSAFPTDDTITALTEVLLLDPNISPLLGHLLCIKRDPRTFPKVPFEHNGDETWDSVISRNLSSISLTYTSFNHQSGVVVIASPYGEDGSEVFLDAAILFLDIGRSNTFKSFMEKQIAEDNKGAESQDFRDVRKLIIDAALFHLARSGVGWAQNIRPEFCSPDSATLAPVHQEGIRSCYSTAEVLKVREELEQALFGARLISQELLTRLLDVALDPPLTRGDVLEAVYPKYSGIEPKDIPLEIVEQLAPYPNSAQLDEYLHLANGIRDKIMQSHRYLELKHPDRTLDYPNPMLELKIARLRNEKSRDELLAMVSANINPHDLGRCEQGIPRIEPIKFAQLLSAIGFDLTSPWGRQLAENYQTRYLLKQKI